MKSNKFKLFLNTVSMCTLSILSACTTAMNNEVPRSAIILESNQTNTHILSQAMSSALKGKKVSLVSSAFLKNSQHILQTKMRGSINGNATNGLILGIPEAHHFSLYTTNNSCYLVYENTGEQYPLKGLNCKPL